MSLQVFLFRVLAFINETVIPFILAIAFVVFLFNIARYFIIKRDEDRKEARQLALWGILAFVLIVSIWGIVNLLVSGLGFAQQIPPCPDYNPNCSVGDGESDTTFTPRR